MNRFLPVFSILATGILSSPAAFEMPKHVYRMSDIETARAAAREKGVPVAFIYTSESTSCGLCRWSSLTIADELKRKAVIVYSDSNDRSGAEWNGMPPVAQQGLRAEAAGKFIPKTVIVDAEFSTLLATIPYGRGEEQVDAIKAAVKQLPDRETPSRRPTLPSPATPQVAAVTYPAEARVWTSRSGSTISARLTGESGGFLQLVTDDGRQLKIQASNLSDADQQYLATLRP